MRSVLRGMRSSEYDQRGLCAKSEQYTSDMLSHLACLSSFAWFACFPSVSSLELPLYVFSCAVPPLVYIHVDATSAFTLVPGRE